MYDEQYSHSGAFDPGSQFTIRIQCDLEQVGVITKASCVVQNTGPRSQCALVYPL